MSHEKPAADATIAALQQEREKLQRLIAELREENDYLRKSLGKLLVERIEVDKEKVLRDFDNWPSFRQVIAELDQSGGAYARL